MNSDDEFQMWLNTQRGESPPTELTDRIMVSVREQALESVISPPRKPAHETVWQRSIPYLVLSAAAIVLTLRVFSIVSLLVVPTSIAEVTMIEPQEEDSHEP